LKIARTVLVAGALAALAVSPGATQERSRRDAPAGGQPTSLGPGEDFVRVVREPFWAKRLTGYLKTRDGTELRYSVLLPKGKGPFPTLLHYSGYDVGSIGGSEYLKGNHQYVKTIDKDLIDAGYAIIGVNARATGCSAGDSFDWHRPLYGQDGYDAVEFAAAQPWSNGNVGMYSWSWAGMSQLWTASFRPPHLKAITPGMVIANPRADSYAPGGVPQPAMISGWTQSLLRLWDFTRESAVGDGDTRCAAQVERNKKTLEEGAPGVLVLQHQFRDDHLEERNVSLRTHLINVPVLSVTGFQDGATTSRGGYYQETVDPNLLWMVDTNGDHSMYSSETFRKTLIRFLDRYVKGQRNGFESTPRLQVWEETKIDPVRLQRGGIERNVEASGPNFVVSRPSIRPAVDQVSFALTADGGLKLRGAAAGEPRTMKYPLVGPAVRSSGWGPASPDWTAGALAYTSDPLDKDLVVYGPISADLWISADRSDADVQVTVTAVMPDGQEMYVQRGWLRLSNRALDPARSTPGRPVLLDTPTSFKPMWPNRPELARVEVNRVSFPFRKGVRLRIWIDTPSPTGSYNFAYNPVPATLRVWNDAQHPSKVVLNVLPSETAKAPAVPCGRVLGQPCRADPLAADAR
jgi:predicted acyl esterase